MKLKIAFAAAVAMIALAGPASAASITYKFSGVFDGTLNGQTFSGVSATFTGIGDTDTSTVVNGDTYKVTLTSLSAAASDGFTYNLTGSPLEFRNQVSGPYAAFTTGSGAVPLFVASSPAFFPYNGKTDFAETSVGFFSGTGGLFSTDRGNVQFSNVSNLTFSSSLGAISAVPEPATWALMIGGFGMVGGTMRRRKVNSTVRFA